MGNELNIPKTIVNRITKKNGLYPFHFTNAQNLKRTDFQKRRTFSRWLLATERKVPLILWTDECTFTRDGMFNIHNEHTYDLENPFLHHEKKFQHRFKLNIWAGILDDRIIGPYLMPETLRGHSYLIFLRDILPELLDDVPLNIRRQIILMHDGCPAHRYRPVVEYLNETFGQNWIGYMTANGIHTEWPPRSPDMTPPDFWLWGYIKTLVYQNPLPENEEEAEMEMIARIHSAFAMITPEMTRKSTQHVINCCRKCLEKNGEHFQANL